MVKERILWLDSLKLFAIYLMVLGHCLLGYKYNGLENSYQNSLCMFIYSFHMPLFMVVSGYFSRKLLEGKIEIKKRCVQLMLPCLSFLVICYANGIYDQNFWYLKSLLICYLTYSVLCLLPVNWEVRHLIVVIGLLVFSPLLQHIKYLDVCKVDFMLPFFGSGLIIAQNNDFINTHAKRIFLLSLFCFVGLCFLWDWQYIWYFSKPHWIDYRELLKNHLFVFDIGSLYSYVLRFLIGLTGSICFFTLFCWLTKVSSVWNKLMKVIGGFGKYSLHVYLLQCIIFPFNFVTTNENLYTYCVAPIRAVLITALCIVIAYILKKISILDFILFGNYNYLNKK